MPFPVLVVLALVLLLVLIRPMRRAWKLGVLLANTVPGRLTDIVNRIAPSVTMETRHYTTGEGEKLPLRIYHPHSSGELPAFILYHGASPAAEEHQVVNPIAESLARVGFRVFMPRLPKLKEVLIRRDTGERIVEVFEQVSSRADVDREKIVVAGLSFGGSLLIKACLDERMRGKPAFVLSYGSYFDLGTTLRFVLTGDFSDGTHHYHMEPHEWGRIVFFHNFLEQVDGDFDPAVVRSYFLQLIENGEEEAAALHEELADQDREFIDMLMKQDSGNLELAEEVLPRVQPVIEELSPKYFLDEIDFPLLLMHGAKDNMIPFAETTMFHQALLQRGKSVRTFVSYSFSHSEVEGGRRGPSNFVREIWRMAAFLNQFLRLVV